MSHSIPLYCNSTRESIERRAREIFEQRGRPEGRDLDHWIQAETEHWDSCLPDHLPMESDPAPAAWDTLG
ncbi:MAG: hypothetical protein RIT19_1219 [Verrucomicrobiota bacterium]|jgi:hypothetical protein